MSEIEQFFGHLREVPDSQCCIMDKVFSNNLPTLGFRLAGPDTPACVVKEHLLDIMHYCAVAFSLPYDHSELKKLVFKDTLD